MRGTTIVWCVCAAFSIACGGGSSDDDDGADTDAAVAVDAPETGVLVVSVGDVDVTVWDFGNVAVGSSAAVALTVANAGASTVGAPVGTVSGGDASEFSVDAGASSCTGVTELAAGASCSLVAHFTPTGAGAKATTLAVTASSGGVAEVQLEGTGIGDTALLAFDPPAPNFGLVEIGQSPQQTVTVTNPGSADVSLVGASVTGTGFASAGSTCAGTLGPGASCEVTLQFAPTGIGLATGTLRVTTGSGDATAGIGGSGAGRITVVRAGTGAGTVTSSSAGIDCGDTCSALFAEPVTLIATAAALSSFETWDGTCGTASLCEVTPSVTPTTVTATFGPDTGIRTLTVNVTGTEFGVVEYEPPGDLGFVECEDTCVVNAPSGSSVTLFAATPGAFAGWSGGCTGTDVQCSITLDADVLLTATFEPDVGSVATLLPSASAHRAAFDPSDALIVASSVAVRKLDAAGDDVWSVSLPGGGRVHGMETDASGNVYVVVFRSADAQLHKITAAGVLEWTETIAGAANDYGFVLGDALAVAPGGDVGVSFTLAGVPTLRVYDSAQNELFTVPTADGLGARCVDVDSAGTWYLGREGDFDESVTMFAFDSAGVPLGELLELPGYYRAYCTVDGTGEIVASTSGHSDVDITRTGAGGFSIKEDVPAFSAVSSTGADVTAEGDPVFVRPVVDRDTGGMVLRTYSPSGTLEYELNKPLTPTTASYEAGIALGGIATDSTGRIAVVGQFQTNARLRNWIGIYDPP